MIEPLLSDTSNEFQLDWQNTLATEKSKYPDSVNTKIIEKDDQDNKAEIDKDPDAQRQIDAWGYFETDQAESIIYNLFAKLGSLSHVNDNKDWWHHTLRHGEEFFEKEEKFVNDDAKDINEMDRQLYVQIHGSTSNWHSVFQYPTTKKFDKISSELESDPYFFSDMVAQS